MDKIINKIIYLKKNEVDNVNFYYVEQKKEYTFKIYDLDDRNTILTRLSSLIKIIPKYIYEIKKKDIDDEEEDEEEKEDENEEEEDEEEEEEEDEEEVEVEEEEVEEEEEEEDITNNIYVGNFLDDLKNLMYYYGEINLKSFYTKNKKIINKLNLNILNDIAKPYIIYLLGNNEYREILKYGGSQQYIDEFVKDVDKIEKGLSKGDFVKLWNDLHDEYNKNIWNKKMKDIEQYIVKSEKKTIEIEKLFDKFNFKPTCKHEKFIKDEETVNVQLKYTNTSSLLDLFNSIELNETIPFASCTNYFKILNNYIPDESWIKKQDFLELKLLKAYEDKKTSYVINISIDQTYLLKFNYSRKKYTSKKILNDLEDEYEENEVVDDMYDYDITNEIINHIKNVMEINYDNMYSTNIGGYFNINIKQLTTEFNKKVFSDMVMTNEYFYNFLTLDESKQTQTTKKYYFVKYTDLFTVIITVDSDNIRIKLQKSNANIKDIEKFQLIFVKLLDIYVDNYKNIVDFYKKYLSNIEYENFLRTDENKKKNKPKDKKQNIVEIQEKRTIAPDIFVNNYSSVCAYSGNLKILNEDSLLEEARKKNYQVMTYPINSDDYNFPDKYTNKSTLKFSCFDDTYKYPGVMENKKLINKDTFPLIPCCYKKDQRSKKYHQKNFTIETNEDGAEKQQNIIITDKILNKDVYGELNRNISSLFDDFDDSTYLRKGFEKNNNIFIKIVLDSLNINSEIEDVIEELRMNVVYSRQENYNLSVDEIYDLIDSSKRINPYIYISILENIYKCNIYIFNKDTLLLPTHQQQYYKFKNDNPCVIIYENNYEKEPHYELIVKSFKDKITDKQFKQDSGIIKKIKYIQNELYNVNYIDNVFYYDDNYSYFYNNLNIISQVIDVYGKTRILNVLIEDNKYISLFTSPLPPLNIKEDIIDNIYYIEDSNDINMITDALQIEQVTVSKNIVTGMLKNTNITVQIKIKVDDEIIDNLSKQYIKHKRVSRYVIEYMFWLYSNFILNNNYLKIRSFEYLKEFKENYFEIDSGYKYEIVHKKYSLSDNGILRNGKIIVKSEEVLNRLLYVLKVKLIRDFENIVNYHRYEYIYNYYLEITDFDVYPNQTIFKDEDYTNKSMLSNKTIIENKYLVFNKILITDKSYFFRNKLIDNNTYIACNTDSLKKAIFLCEQWNTKKNNASNVINFKNIKDGITKKYNYKLYSYINYNNIKEFLIKNTEDSIYNIKIIGYRIKGKPNYTSLLLFQNQKYIFNDEEDDASTYQEDEVQTYEENPVVIVRLENMSNYCYMNTVLQLIHRIKSIVSDEFVLEDGMKYLKKSLKNISKVDYSAIGEVFLDIINYYYQEQVKEPKNLSLLFEISGRVFNDKLGIKDNFDKQQDIVEFINIFFEKILLESCGYKENNNYYGGDDHEFIKSYEQTDFLLSLPIDKNTNDIQECYEKYTEIQELEKPLEDVDYDKCYKKMEIKNTSDNLLIMLKRFEYNMKTRTTKKIKNQVKINKLLIIDNEKFKIDSCIYHTGKSTRSGHYIILIYDDNGNPSYIINDLDHTEQDISEETIEKNAYLLLYKKV